jgi:hypothetical protein
MLETLICGSLAAFSLQLQCPVTSDLAQEEVDKCVQAALTDVLGATSVKIDEPEAVLAPELVPVESTSEVATAEESTTTGDVALTEDVSATGGSVRRKTQSYYLCHIVYDCYTTRPNSFYCNLLNCPGWRRTRHRRLTAVTSASLVNIELDLEDCITAAGGTYAGPCTAEISF